ERAERRQPLLLGTLVGDRPAAADERPALCEVAPHLADDRIGHEVGMDVDQSRYAALVQAATDELRLVGGQGNRHGHAGHPLRPAHPASHSGLPPDLCRTLWPKGTRTPQSAVMPDPPMSVASSPVTLALTIC